MRVLLVEDNQTLAAAIQRQLHFSYTVDHAEDLKTGLQFLRLYPYHLVILDWQLPDGQGIDLSQRARRDGLDMPILMLTAKDLPTDKVAGLEAGADDYLTKPFHRGELQARLRALLRRQPLQTRQSSLTAGLLSLDLASARVWFDQTPLNLTRTEFQILELLLRYKHQVVSKDMIWHQIWSFNSGTSINSIEAHIKNLRQKIDRRFEVSLIQTIRGLGYKLELLPIEVPASK